MDDRRIVELYLTRDERAITETIAKYGAALHTLSFRIVQNETESYALQSYRMAFDDAENGCSPISR